jgi:hypothetical protein
MARARRRRSGKTTTRSSRVERRSTQTMTQTTFTIAALVVGFTIAALFILSAIAMGAVAGT